MLEFWLEAVPNWLLRNRFIPNAFRTSIKIVFKWYYILFKICPRFISPQKTRGESKNQKLNDTSSLFLKFCKTIAESKKETLFITGGMDTEIIEMMDEAMKAHKNQSINTIGIMKWNDVHQNQKLVQNQKTKRILVSFTGSKVINIFKTISF